MSDEAEGCLGIALFMAVVVVVAFVWYDAGRDDEREKWCKQAYVTATASDSLRLQRVDKCPMVTP